MITYVFGMDFPPLKLKKNNFGSGILTNVSKSTCYEGYAPHIDFLNTNILMIILTPWKRVITENG